MQILPMSLILSGALTFYTEAYIEQSPIDEDLSIIFCGPEADEEIRIKAQVVNDEGLLWTSLGLFQVDEFGVWFLASKQ